MATPKRRGRAVSAGREYRAGGSAAAGQTPHNCAWISNFLSPSDHLAPLIARGAFSTGSGNRQLQIINDRMQAKPAIFALSRACIARGTGRSNPSPSSRESATNRGLQPRNGTAAEV